MVNYYISNAVILIICVGVSWQYLSIQVLCRLIVHVENISHIGIYFFVPNIFSCVLCYTIKHWPHLHPIVMYFYTIMLEIGLKYTLDMFCSVVYTVHTVIFVIICHPRMTFVEESVIYSRENLNDSHRTFLY
jgi:hypothetical protein